MDPTYWNDFNGQSVIREVRPPTLQPPTSAGRTGPAVLSGRDPPLSEADPRITPRPVNAPSTSKRRVLVVEDDSCSSRALRMILAHLGWKVAMATTVAEAMDQLAAPGGAESANASESRAWPEWVVLDLMLPDGDGEAVLRHIRARGLPVRVTVATGIDDPARLARVEQLCPDNLLRKPIDVAELLRM